mmetsp:Transcript_5174/g.18558  ORF Transcript_5174/g.18558 Transcript_5174/m.18558 type:complete len:271 (+) Transcript_5174:1403-2215(+)
MVNRRGVWIEWRFGVPLVRARVPGGGGDASRPQRDRRRGRTHQNRGVDIHGVVELRRRRRPRRGEDRAHRGRRVVVVVAASVAHRRVRGDPRRGGGASSRRAAGGRPGGRRLGVPREGGAFYTVLGPPRRRPRSKVLLRERGARADVSAARRGDSGADHDTQGRDSRRRRGGRAHGGPRRGVTLSERLPRDGVLLDEVSSADARDSSVHARDRVVHLRERARRDHLADGPGRGLLRRRRRHRRGGDGAERGVRPGLSRTPAPRVAPQGGH